MYSGARLHDQRVAEKFRVIVGHRISAHVCPSGYGAVKAKLYFSQEGQKISNCLGKYFVLDLELNLILLCEKNSKCEK